MDHSQPKPVEELGISNGRPTSAGYRHDGAAQWCRGFQAEDGVPARPDTGISRPEIGERDGRKWLCGGCKRLASIFPYASCSLSNLWHPLYSCPATEPVC